MSREYGDVVAAARGAVKQLNREERIALLWAQVNVTALILFAIHAAGGI